MEDKTRQELDEALKIIHDELMRFHSDRGLLALIKVCDLMILTLSSIKSKLNDSSQPLLKLLKPENPNSKNIFPKAKAQKFTLI